MTAAPTDVVEKAELLTTELVINALTHGQGEAIIRIDTNKERLRVEVLDRGPALNLHPLRFDASSPNGRGLFLVDALASSWGVQQHEERKACGSN